MRLIISAVVLVISLSACTDGEVYISGPAKEKSIVAPPGMRGAAGAVKDVFREAGWATFVSGRTLSTTGTAGSVTNLQTGVQYPARYTALTASTPFDICIGIGGSGRKVHYDISIIDNETGQEVAAFSGSACESTISDSVRDSLEGFL